MIMKMTERKVTDRQMADVAAVMVHRSGLVNLDGDDVRTILEDRSGMLYQGVKDADEDNKTFLTSFCSELSGKSHHFKYIMICFGFPEDAPMMMDELIIVNQFLHTNDHFETTMWGLYSKPEKALPSIEVLCTTDIDQ